MITIVSFSTQSDHGRASGKFDGGVSCDSGAGFGKLLVAFGTIRKVDAGASTFFISGFDMLDVCNRGPSHH